MTRITNFKRILCCLLACVVLCCAVMRPLTVKAVEPVSMTVVGVSAVCVVAAILIAIGLEPLVESSISGFNALVNDIVSVLPTEFVVISSVSGYLVKMIMADGITYAPRNLVEWIVDYLLASEAVTFSSVYPYTISSYEEICEYLTVNDAEDYAYAQTYNRLYHFTFPDSTTVTEGWVWTDSNVTLLKSTLSSGGYQYSLRFYGPYCISFNAGLSLSAIDVFDDTLTYPRNVVMTYSDVATGTIEREDKEEGYVTSLDGIAVTDVFSETLDATWTGESITVTDTEVGTDVAAIPLSVPATVADTVATTREEVIAGTATKADTVTLDETITDTSTATTGLLSSVLSWLEKIWTAIKSLVSGITAPIVNAITSVKTQVVSLVNFFTATSYVESPLVAINFGALFELFPFNIPYGIYQAISFWDSGSEAPVLTVPLPTFTGGAVDIYEFEIDFSEIPGMDVLVSIIRAGELILFAVGLLMITRKVTKW